MLRVWSSPDSLKREQGRPVEARHDDSRSLIAAVRDVAVAASVYLYFCGFLYSYYLNRRLGIPSSATETPFYQYVVFSYNVFSGWSVLLAPVAGALAWLLYRGRHSIAWRIATYTTAIAMFPAVQLLSSNAAAWDAHRMRRGENLKTVVLHFKGEASRGLPEDLLEANTEEQLHLLAHSKTAVFVLIQSEMAEGQLPYGRVYEIPTEDLAGMTTKLASEEEPPCVRSRLSRYLLSGWLGRL